MKAVQFSEHGGPEVLKLIEVDTPVPGEGQVRVAVRAAGVNPIEWKQRSGMTAARYPMELPAGLGRDIAGVVDQVGEAVTELAVGDEVFGVSSTPSYAEFALAEPANLAIKPPELSFEAASGLGGPGRTAWRTLVELNVGDGDTLLILAGAGGVGTLACQLGRIRGARVLATASEANHDYLRSLGAEPIAYGEGWEDRVRALAPDGVDAVLDASGRGELEGAIALAGGPDRVLTIAAYNAADFGVVFSGPMSKVDESPALGELAERLASGAITPPATKTYPLSDAETAHRDSEAGHLRGKLVLVP